MKYLKVFTDFRKAIKPFSDDEKGRLFDAMLEYAETGIEPNFTGNERFIWPTAKSHIDREDEFCKRQKENGIRGGRKPNETQSNPNEPNETQKSQKDKDKEKKRKEYKDTSLRSVSYCDDEILNNAVLAFVEFRKKIKKPMTEHAVDLLVRKLDVLANCTADKVEILNQSIINGWAGVYELKGKDTMPF